MPSDLAGYEHERTRLEGLRQSACDDARRKFNAAGGGAPHQQEYDAAIRAADRAFLEGVAAAAVRFEIHAPNVHDGLRHVR